jgi:hypothetical protein
MTLLSLKIRFPAYLLILLFKASTLFGSPPPPPSPAIPISSPLPGMAWTITILDAKSGESQPIVIQGSCGTQYREDTVQYPSGYSQQWFTFGRRLFAISSEHNEIREIPLQDGAPEAAKSFHVKGFPGISWVTPETPLNLEFDKEHGIWVSVYEQIPAGFDVLGSGENQIAVPSGPMVPVKAYFDATSGLPLRAMVDGMLYKYEVQLNHAKDVPLPASLESLLRELLQSQLNLKRALESLQAYE